jgi:hypothetical protein
VEGGESSLPVRRQLKPNWSRAKIAIEQARVASAISRMSELQYGKIPAGKTAGGGHAVR